MFNKILIANRGEIAVRVIRACRLLGVPTVAVYSEVDAGGVWTRLADEAYALPGATAGESYLNQEAILAIAAEAGADAIHPGYGFLSENADFAAACARRGVKFIGPSPEAMRALGDKSEARQIARRAGVPVVPGVDGAGLAAEELEAAAERIGYPVLIKASAGGGGKGMRVVDTPAGFAEALQAARREASSAFGDDHVLVEKYFSHVHHVEIQVLGDEAGHIIHLFERECSIQRRHQKIIEESPAPILSSFKKGKAEDEVRQKMAAAAVALAKAVGYSNAGTVEFVVDDRGRFYFLEMNTRLQVEHPVTELVTGIDLVVWQIRIAAGQPLALAQDEVRQRGHAIECRLYAEEPARGFIPSTGRIACYRPPSGPGLRLDDGIETGTEVTPYYDPMLAKLIAWGADREEALSKMHQALEDTIVLGVTTNLAFLRAILEQPAFAAGRTPTDFVAEQMAEWQPPAGLDETGWLAAAALELLQGDRRPATGDRGDGAQREMDPWALVGDWRNV